MNTFVSKINLNISIPTIHNSFEVFFLHIHIGADWYELTKDSVPATQTSHRLALLHFDWDNAKPETIYMVLESFLPARGHIEKVTVSH